ncbi:hypothetical protein [Asticcacaulis sp. AND118]|uniref:hypothetical protein n=1 Tax=Asticcacaulis sp. AND118 TaxID=2840468 RepID=UPI001CFF6857|nr:hypothetical protein [Asticcacaulis sp. AND118]UDF03507.1 hypothetical protein LH365_00265 [Asticcacaulis sp. AND118]
MIASRLSALMLALALTQPALAQTPATQSDAPGTNPIIRDVFTADPAALVVGDKVGVSKPPAQ